jgi:broad-specificity NMP kinase
MNTTSFYKELKEIKDFSQIMEDSNFTVIPNDWFVLVSDIKESTKAIEEGMYKKVNFVAALTIIGILNIDKNLEFPYIFGGDGASLIIPPHLQDKAKIVLLETAKKAKEVFDLDLRVGIISIKEIEERGSFIEVTKLKVTNDYTQAIVRGNGLELAEYLLKKEYKNFKIDENFSCDYLPNFDGLECRWEDIKSPKDETSSLLIKSTNQKKSNEIYQNVLNKIDEIAGSYRQRNPIKEINQLVISFNPMVLNAEASVFSSNIFFKFFMILKLMFENLLGVVLIKYSLGQWGDYKNRVIRTTDTEKFDDMLRMVISTNKAQTKEIEEYLEQEYQKDNLVYGIHKSDSALMTCLIFERHGKHIHFVDSSNGGYALASKELKARLKAKE